MTIEPGNTSESATGSHLIHRFSRAGAQSGRGCTQNMRPGSTRTFGLAGSVVLDTTVEPHVADFNLERLLAASDRESGAANRC